MLRNFSNYAITKKKLQQTLLRRIGRQSLYINNRQLICIPPIRSNSSFPTAQSLIIVSQKMESSKIANSPLTNIFNKNTNLHLPIQSRKILRFQLIIVITVKFVQSITTPARASVQISWIHFINNTIQIETLVKWELSTRRNINASVIHLIWNQNYQSCRKNMRDFNMTIISFRKNTTSIARVYPRKLKRIIWMIYQELPHKRIMTLLEHR